MFCPNCGKEQQEGVRFCQYCGASVNVKGMETVKSLENENSQGVTVCREFDSIIPLEEQERKSQKRWKAVSIVLGVLFVWMSLRALAESMGYVWDGTYGWMYPVQQIVGLAIMASGVMFFLFKVSMKATRTKCMARVQEMLRVIRVEENQGLKHTLEQLSCSSIQNVYMDENGDVCVRGKYGIHRFLREQDTLTLVSQKDTYKADLEKEIIVGNLLKHLAPDTPINAFERERRNKKLAKAGRSGIVLAVSFAVFCVLSASDFVFGLGGVADEGYKFVSLVKNGHPERYPNISYADAFGDFFADRHWKYFRSTDGQDVVEFHGDCRYDDRTADVGLQFIISYEDKTFELYAMDMDGEAQPTFLMYLLVMKVFEDYGGESQGTGGFNSDDQIPDIQDSDNFNADDWNIGNTDTGSGQSEQTDAGDAEADGFNETGASADLGTDMGFLEGTYARSIGPKCDLSIWTADENGIFFTIGIGPSGYLAYAELSDVMAEWTDENTAVYTNGNYSVTFHIGEDGGIWLEEDDPAGTDFTFSGDYNKADLKGEYAEYVFPDSDTSYITIADFDNTNAASDCKIGRNEIYARHGRRFDDEQLQAYFDQCSWYLGTIEPQDFSDDVLNEVERENLQMIIDYETSMGYR